MAPDVVPGRDHVGAGLEDAVGELGGQADPVRRVLAVHDAEIGLKLVLELRQPVRHRPAARWPEDVADEEKLQRAEPF